MLDLKCDPRTCAGSIDDRVMAEFSKRYPLDPNYLTCLDNCHGGQPQIGTIISNDCTYRLAFFLTLVDGETNLPGAFRPHFDCQNIDERVVNSVSTVLNSESITARCLFENIVPFASTQHEMCLDRGYVDLFCFDYRKQQSKPAVVLWDANNAVEAYFEWESLSIEEQFDDNENLLNVPWEKFLVPIADSFANFTKILQPNF